MAELIWKSKPSTPLVLASAHLHISETFLSQAHDWHNRLIYGDKSDVLPALLPEFANAVDLIYIDPPFMTGRDFISGTQFAYSDKWQNDIDVYLQWLYETFLLLHLILSEHGSLYVHLDWRATHYAKLILDEVF